MIIQKEYKFYAAHRNRELNNKCSNLHGHRYGLICHFEVERSGDISTIFSDFDDKIEPYLKENYDHSMLIHDEDPLYETLLSHMDKTGEKLLLKVFPRATTVENLAHHLYCEIIDLGFQLAKLEVRETDTSVISYTKEDWVNDSRIFSLQSQLSN